jgi:cytochrome P450
VTTFPRTIPKPDGLAGLYALRRMIRQRSVLAAFEAFHEKLGNVFRLQLSGFHPVVLVGPDANRFVLVEQQEHLAWRSPTDPIARLLGHGLLVEDGPALHDQPRAAMMPALRARMMPAYIDAMWRGTNAVLRGWQDGQTVDMLEAMRHLSLLGHTLRLMRFISPGAWMLWPGAPSPGYQKARAAYDACLHDIIARRRASYDPSQEDLLGLLIGAGYDDAMIRDEMMTMVVAGHDTTTALLAWVWVLLGQHADVLAHAQDEARTVLGPPDLDAPVPSHEQVRGLAYTESLVKETLRLYPPAHLGSRIALKDLEYAGYHIPAGERVIYSIYLTQRMAEYWPEPTAFRPERFAREAARPAAFSYLPFGGGPRLCIGNHFGEQQAIMVVARVLQCFDVSVDQRRVGMHMGATIEPRQGRHGISAVVRRRV